MQWYYRLGPGQRMALSGAALVAMIVVVLLTLADLGTERNRAATESNAVIVGQLARSATEYVVNGDHLALQALLGELSRSPGIDFAQITDAEQRTLAESGQAAPNDPALVAFTDPIRLGDVVIGFATIKVRQPHIEQFTPTHIALLGGVVFILSGLFLIFRMLPVDHALELANARLAALQLGGDAGPAHDAVAQLSHLAESAMERFAPPQDEAAGAALALRLAALGDDYRGPRPPPLRLAEFAVQVGLAAGEYGAAACGRQDGWLLSFRNGEHRAARALDCARALETLLTSGRGGLEWAMAMDVEAVRPEALPGFGGNGDDRPSALSGLRELHWQRSCELLYREAHRDGALLLTRLALSVPAINEQVHVCEEGDDLYRVEDYADNTEAEAEPGEPSHPADSASALA